MIILVIVVHQEGSGSFIVFANGILEVSPLSFGDGWEGISKNWQLNGKTATTAT
jgi:hypothetical protein